MNFEHKAVLAGSALLAVVGAAGMVQSFLYMAGADIRDIHAGTSGFIAGALFIAAAFIGASIAVSSGYRRSARSDLQSNADDLD